MLLSGTERRRLAPIGPVLLRYSQLEKGGLDMTEVLSGSCGPDRYRRGAGGSVLDQLVVDLRALDGEVAEAVSQEVNALRKPPRVQVVGRAGAGRATWARALGLAAQCLLPAVDRPGGADPVVDAQEPLLYVLAGTLQPADRRMLLGRSPRHTVVVLNKADTIGANWADAVAAAQRYRKELGLPVVAAVGLLAERTSEQHVTDDDLRTWRDHCARADTSFTISAPLFTGTGAGEDVAQRRKVLRRWGLHAMGCALTALRHDPDLAAPALQQVLHAVSGSDGVAAAVARCRALRSADRSGQLLDELARWAARCLPRPGQPNPGDILEAFLASDQAAELALRAAQAHPQLADLPTNLARAQADPDYAWSAAKQWATAAAVLPPSTRRAATRGHEALLNTWERSRCVA